MKEINTKKEYQKRLELALEKAVKIILPDSLYNFIIEFSDKWTKDKRSIEHFTKDINQLNCRSKHGHLGEAALGHLLGEQFVNLDPKFGFDKNRPDLEPLNLHIGTKTHRMCNPPLINYITNEMYNRMPEDKQKEFRYPQVIITMDNICPKTFYILGLFPPSLLYNNDYTDINLIHDEDLFKKGTKMPFFGVDLGKSFNNMDDLMNYGKPKWLIKN
jgi:hypothetical protein